MIGLYCASSKQATNAAVHKIEAALAGSDLKWTANQTVKCNIFGYVVNRMTVEPTSVVLHVIRYL